MAIITNNPTANDPPQWIDAVWSALHHWRSLALEPNDPTDDKDWSEITTVMAWITEALDCEIDSNGDTVYAEPDPIGALARTHNEPDPEMEQKIRTLMPLVREVLNEGSI